MLSMEYLEYGHSQTNVTQLWSGKATTKLRVKFLSASSEISLMPIITVSKHWNPTAEGIPLFTKVPAVAVEFCIHLEMDENQNSSHIGPKPVPCFYNI